MFTSDSLRKEAASKTALMLWKILTILTPLGMASIAIIVGKDRGWAVLTVSILLGLVFGTAVGFIMGWAMYHFQLWLMPGRFNVLDVRLAYLTIIILAFLLTWMGWRDVPTNTQIDAVRANPHFAAAIAEMNEKKMDPYLVTAAMKNGHARVSRPVLFGIEMLMTSIVLGFLAVAYWVIFRALCAIFKPKPLSPEPLD